MLVAWFVLLPSYLGVWVGFCLVVLVLTCPGKGILRLDHWNPVITGFLVYSKGAAAERLDGTLELRHCTTIFTTRFSPRVGNGGGKRWYVTLGHVPDDRSNVVKRVRLTSKKHVQVHLLMSFRIQGIQRRGDGKDCAALPPKERRVRWACLAIFFLDLVG